MHDSDNLVDRVNGRMAARTEPTLIGEFIKLRPLTVDDAELTLGWRLGARALNLNRGAGTPDQQRAWIASRPDSEMNFIIALLDGRPLGMVSLIGIDLGNRRAEPARFLIGDEEAARGIPVAVEAMKLIYELAFNTLGLVRVHGLIASDNPAMLKWQTYLGMKVEGRLRNHYYINEHFQDAICVGLLEDEFRRFTLPRMRALLAAGRTVTRAGRG